MVSSFRGRVNGTDTALEVGPDVLSSADGAMAWVDADRVRVAGHAVLVESHRGESWRVSDLGSAFDRFVDDLRVARGRARRAALLIQGDDALIDRYRALDDDGEPAEVLLFPHSLVVERLGAPSQHVPLALVESVDRNGYVITLQLRAGDPVTIARLGPRTDELLADLDAARGALSRATTDAYAAASAGLVGYSAPDGWAATAEEAGARWPALLAAMAAGNRSAEVEVLAEVAGPTLRIGMLTGGREGAMPFVLAPVDGRVAVEAADTDGRATFIFETDDVAQLNAALIYVSFRREAISLPEAELGRWALAARERSVVRWARGALVERVVHDGAWERRVRRALAGVTS